MQQCRVFGRGEQGWGLGPGDGEEGFGCWTPGRVRLRAFGPRAPRAPAFALPRHGGQARRVQCTMLRVVERVLGEGDVVRDGQPLMRAGYELTVYREWTPRASELVPGAYSVEGHLLAPVADLERALGITSPATLHLDDGRRFDFYVVNTEGTVTSADERGLYEV